MIQGFCELVPPYFMHENPPAVPDLVDLLTDDMANGCIAEADLTNQSY